MIVPLVALMLSPTGLVIVGHTETLPNGFPVRKGAFAFCRASDLAGDIPEADLAWLARFEVLLTNGYGVPSEHVRETLQSHGCHLFRYFWLNGFPEPELGHTLPDGHWRNDLVAQRPEWLLSPDPLPGPTGTPPSYYLDFGQPELVAYLVRGIADFREANGYAGTFFDYAGSYALPDEVRVLWGQEHPEVLYDEAVIGFLERLRERDLTGLIATNQAHRSAEPLLSVTDYDVIESYGTSYAWGPVARVGDQDVAETFLRPWKGPGGLPLSARLLPPVP